jgi:DNA-binding NarL/FixJ family response regulator
LSVVRQPADSHPHHRGCPPLLRGSERGPRRRAPLDVVGMASDPVQALRQVRDLQPDVVLVDTSMGQAVGAVHAILAAAPAAKVIALAVSEENQDVFGFAEAGVCGYEPGRILRLNRICL